VLDDGAMFYNCIYKPEDVNLIFTTKPQG